MTCTAFELCIHSQYLSMVAKACSALQTYRTTKCSGTSSHFRNNEALIITVGSSNAPTVDTSAAFHAGNTRPWIFLKANSFRIPPSPADLYICLTLHFPKTFDSSLSNKLSQGFSLAFCFFYSYSLIFKPMSVGTFPFTISTK